jgi:hypothetical protein
MSNIPLPYITLEQALTNIIESISREETAAANLLNSESEFIKIAKDYSDNVEELVYLNTSVNDIVKNVVRLQMLLQIKLEETKKFIKKCDDYDELEE